MRIIDYYLGNCLCFPLSLFNTIFRILSFNRESTNDIKKILLIKFSEIGSIILAWPLINIIRKERPDAELFFLTFKKNRQLFEILNVMPVSNVFTIRDNNIFAFIFDTLSALRKIIRISVDVSIDLEFFSRFSAIISYLSGAKKRAGFYRFTMEGLYRGNLLTHRVQYNNLIHISKSYLALWLALDKDFKLSPKLERQIDEKELSLPRFSSSLEEKEKIWEKLRGLNIERNAKLFLINPGEGNLPLREWPIDSFIELIKLILDYKDNYLIIVGTADVSRKAEIICKAFGNNRCIDLSNKTTIPELLVLFNISCALIANDSGLAHLAALTPIPNFVIFGPESPQVFVPLGDNVHVLYANLLCSPCLSVFNHRNSVCDENICLKTIAPEEVFDLLKRNIDEFGK